MTKRNIKYECIGGGGGTGEYEFPDVRTCSRATAVLKKALNELVDDCVFDYD